MATPIEYSPNVRFYRNLARCNLPNLIYFNVIIMQLLNLKHELTSNDQPVAWRQQ